MNIADVPPESVFWILGGKPVKNILELGRELRQMSPETFSHHVTAEKNDFATWVEYSIKDHNLAALLRTTRDQARMAAIIERKIQELTAPPEKPTKIPETVHTHHPTIIKTRNTTPLVLARKEDLHKTIIVKKHYTLPEPKKTVIRAGRTTDLLLVEPCALEKAQQINTDIAPEHHKQVRRSRAAALLVSHVFLGIAVGVAIIIIILI